MVNQLWTIRRYREGDEESILKLRRLCFGDADLDRWIWEFKASPLGSLMIVAEHQEQMVGFYARLPVQMEAGGKILKCSIACDAMVHRNFRRRGLYRQLSNISWEEALKEGHAISFGFSNRVTYKHRLEGVLGICRVPLLVKFFDTYEEIKKRVGNEFLARVFSIFANYVFGRFYRVRESFGITNLRLTEIGKFDGRVDSFWKEASTAFNVAVVRSKEYLNWRYFERPGSNFTVLLVEDEDKILGYSVLSVQETMHNKRGYIIDIVTLPNRPEVIQFLVSTAIDRLRKEKVGLILCMIMKNNQYYRVLRKNGFMALKGSYLTARADYSKVSQALVKDPKNWYITFGDSDDISL